MAVGFLEHDGVDLAHTEPLHLTGSRRQVRQVVDAELETIGRELRRDQHEVEHARARFFACLVPRRVLAPEEHVRGHVVLELLQQALGARIQRVAADLREVVAPAQGWILGQPQDEVERH